MTTAPRKARVPKRPETTVNIATLKAKLSHYLRLVQEGRPVIVLDRKKPVAMLVAIESADGDDEDMFDRAIREGRLRPPRDPRPLPKSFFRPMRGPMIPDEVVLAAVRWAKGYDD